MLTATDSEADKVSGLRLGADDYLTKPFLMNELIARVQSLIRRYTVFNKSNDGNALLEYNGLTIDPSLRMVCVNGNIVHLTAREFDLLYFLAAHQGKVFTKEQIYIHVWPEDYAFDDGNIMSFISKLRKKIKSFTVFLPVLWLAVKQRALFYPSMLCTLAFVLLQSAGSQVSEELLPAASIVPWLAVPICSMLTSENHYFYICIFSVLCSGIVGTTLALREFKRQDL